ncbi:hypothetical protein FQN54_008794 [Arachnomyces sp. PD_36]|nr:hypothetical protein FQN54_008794 [Arachnomyces sp. PD_36]
MASLSSASRNPRRPPEESGSFGRRRNARYHSTRSHTRTGTPAKKENPNVAEFSRLFAQQQEEEKTLKSLPATSSTSFDASRKPAEKVATECILYGYRNKDGEWRVIDKYERISQGYICEDYPRSDPNVSSKYPHVLSGGDVVIHRELSADANRKSKRYAGGYHWIKVTFDSAASADKACYFSPQEIDGHLVYCEIYHGQGPQEDAPIVEGIGAVRPKPKAHTISAARSASMFNADSTDRPTLARTLSGTGDRGGNVEPQGGDRAASEQSTTTASSVTATGVETQDTVRQRQTPKAESEFMTHIPTVRRAALRPMSEALPPQPTMSERVIRSIPILSWFTGDIVGDGPVLRDDGTFDHDKSNLYWRFWYMVDKMLGTDVCGLREDS